MTDRRAHYPPCHPAMLALAALVAAIQHRCDPFPELDEPEELLMLDGPTVRGCCV